MAFSCTVESSAERMTMRKVEAKLVKIKKRFLREVGEINMTDYFLNHEVTGRSCLLFIQNHNLGNPHKRLKLKELTLL